MTSITGKTVLISGATGFLGSHLRQRLSETGAEVHAVSRAAQEDAEPLIRWWQADFSDVSQVRSLFGQIRPDVVYHFSGLSSAAPDPGLILTTFHSQVTSAVNVLTAAREIGDCRVVLPASLTEPESGAAEPIPTSPYSAAKWAVGGYARMFHRLYSVPVVMVRPFMTYGPRQDRRKIVPYLILSLLQGNAPELSSGTQLFDWIYVDDVTEGFVAAGHLPDLDGCTIDLGSGTALSVQDLARRLIELLGTTIEPRFGARPNRPSEWVRMADMQRAYEKLRWEPKVPLDVGLQRTIDWCRQVLSCDAVEAR